MRRDAKIPQPKPEQASKKNAAPPHWAYEIDFRTGDIRRRMLAALDLQP
jgi:hypothetical protein